jgi:urea transporter
MVLGVLRAYSNILFVDQPLIGLAFLLATFWFPNVGLAGLIGATVGMAVGYALRLPYATSGVNVYSSLLVGLSIGAFYRVDVNLAILIVLSATLTVLLAATLRDLLWRIGHLPVLSVPFVIVALTTALAAGSYGGLTLYLEPSALPPAYFGNWFDAFLTSLGSVFFSPHPLVGILLFTGILLQSRFLALLCIAGFASGEYVFTALTVDPSPGLLAWTGFNFALTAMAVGGVFLVPSIPAFALAIAGASASAVVTAALSRLFIVYSLPVMAAPFLLTTLTILAALRLRVTTAQPTLLLDHPGLPEANFERARLGRARLGEPGSVPLLAPFYGSWQIYQAFDGKHTHRNRWRFALDFHRIDDGKSYAGDGSRLTDYYCYGLPVLSPAFGIVVGSKDDLPDNTPGAVDLRNNWGNYVVIQSDSGIFVLLAHLQRNSVRVKRGERVTPETVIASCGSSGRSPQPHLHLQVQQHASLGSSTLPFHLVSAVVRAEDGPTRFELVARPSEGDSVQRADEDFQLAAALQLPVGRTLTYAIEEADGTHRDERLRVDVSLLGQMRLNSESGASAAFEYQNSTLAFYDRQGNRDALLDLWCLALGLTPLSSSASRWQDSPPARLLPMRVWQRVMLALFRPLGAGLDSRYKREWIEEQGVWQQHGEHRLKAARRVLMATTLAVLSPASGCVRLSMECCGERRHAELNQLGQVADRGIPRWQAPVGPGNETTMDSRGDTP